MAKPMGNRIASTGMSGSDFNPSVVVLNSFDGTQGTVAQKVFDLADVA